MPVYRTPLTKLLESALAARQPLLDEKHETAFRLFNGFYEGWPELVFDVYGRTLVVHNYAEDPLTGRDAAGRGVDFLAEKLPWVTAAVIKHRRSSNAAERRGDGVWGDPDRSIWENGVRYAVELQLNRDASFYLDTRLLRAWLLEKAAGRSVLNTFAYTGSLGVAAAAGGASRVIHTDLSRRFLNVAKTSYTLNGLPIERRNFMTGDFFMIISRLKRDGARFDLVILDPPFFSTTPMGTVDVARNLGRLINKLRPLVVDGGRLVAVNNGLFVRGAEYAAEIEELGQGGFVELEEIIPVPEDITGFDGTIVAGPPVDPAPFNHPTKIAVLRVRHR